ncbi:MAG: ergothioneine biosynthesis protein EgtC [Leptolyngbyaceae cyanobacterium bins.302]|nr:ergothioneine biosynthesis protein EgtC [Leptolyngbyaceae cyanobacterium bins.302]
MCRLLGYLGRPIALEQLLYEPEHSLVVQSYQPREMTSGVVNADGFGVGWYHADRATAPFNYKTILPVWNDVNLVSLSRYIESGCVVANVRSATAGQSVDLVNCQPFQQHDISFIHNGFIANFRETLYRPLRERLSDSAYQQIQGTTDSEHIFALLMDELDATGSLPEALQQTIATLHQLADKYQTEFSANMIVSDGKQLVASRFANREPVPTLYWLAQSEQLPDAVLVASEPMFTGNWSSFGDRSLLTVNSDFSTKLISL